jgi:two-component system, cell cycle sensor histidine kinase and response regulator CckA
VATLVVVEDNRRVREVACAILYGAGHRVVAAADAREAEAVFSGDETFDLLLTDLVLPGVSGPELAERLRRKRPALKVLFMSGYSDDALARRHKLPAGSAFIGKPFGLAELEAKVEEVLSASLVV